MQKNNFDIIALKFSPDEIQVKKREFARLLVKYLNDETKLFGSMEYQLLFGSETACALFALRNWVTDSEVFEYKKEYVNGDKSEETLWTKADICRKYTDIIEKSRDEKVQLVALREMADILGYRQKNTLQLEGTGETNVLLLRDNGSNETWEERVRANQFKLSQLGEDIEDVNEPQTTH